jgi:hypothetical protein
MLEQLDFNVLIYRLLWYEEKIMPKKLNQIGKARQTIWRALERDPGLKLAYRANVAMLMYDMLHARGYRPKLKPDDRNDIADIILEVCFRT